MAVIVTWTGKSGARYEFETFPVGTQFNHVSGVYIACRRLITGNFEALYVGEAQSLFDRINSGAANHDGLKCAARNGMTHIGAILVSGNAERLRVETDLRHALNPSCNKQTVPLKGNALRG
jgi:excinuclease UvrABC nuclease subunit